MKPQPNFTRAFPLCFCAGLALSAGAAITGQWDFKETNYNPLTYTLINAAIGQAITPADQATTSGTQFGSTTSFGIASIGGQATNVMRFPQAVTGFGGYMVPVGANANGGGAYVNQYTVILDVLFTNTPPSGKTYTLLGTDYNGFGGEFFVNSSGAVGCAGDTGGSLTPNAWHRVAIAVDLTDASSGLSVFIDGASVLSGGAPSGVERDVLYLERYLPLRRSEHQFGARLHRQPPVRRPDVARRFAG